MIRGKRVGKWYMGVCSATQHNAILTSGKGTHCFWHRLTRKPKRIRCPRDSDWCDGVICRADQQGFKPDCPNSEPMQDA